MSDHVAVVGTGAFVGEAAGRGGLCCVVGMPSFPAAPNFVDDRARAEWERAFAGNVERYYSLCDRVVSTWGACRVDGKFVFGTGAGVVGCLPETDGGSGLTTVGGFGGRTDSCVCQAKLGCAERGAAGSVAGSDGGGVVEVGAELESCNVDRLLVSNVNCESGGTAVECVVAARSKNARKRAAQRARRAAEKRVGEQNGVVSPVVVASEVAGVDLDSGVAAPNGSGAFVRSDLECVVSVGERKQLAREWYERKRAENALATQRARYNFKRNEYLDRARISEKRWEQERLTCEQKLARITEARFGSKPGYAETLASVSDGSEIPPSLSTGGDSPANLSDGTISPGSSMSVAEENRLKKKVEDLAGEVAQLKLERVALNAACKFSGGKAVVEGGRVHVYDGSGQYVPPTPVYGSECELYSMGDYPEELQYC